MNCRKSSNQLLTRAGTLLGIVAISWLLFALPLNATKVISVEEVHATENAPVLAGVKPTQGQFVYGRSAGLKVNPAVRQESAAFFHKYYVKKNPEFSWTGDFDSCDAGTTSQAFRDVTLQQVNYFRAMAGVPADITFRDAYNASAQSAALMMAVNNQLTHYPPASWQCFSGEGAAGAYYSNLTLGGSGALAIASQMNDFGEDNGPVGHRRWILYPQTLFMGTGNIPPSDQFGSANALWVNDEHYSDPRPSSREEFVAWPPPGYVPYQVVYARWSFSYPNAGFLTTEVSMQRNGVAIPVKLEQVSNGYGENTLVWIPENRDDWDSWSRPAEDIVYRVTVHDVSFGFEKRDFTYEVTVFDPDKPVFLPFVTFGSSDSS